MSDICKYSSKIYNPQSLNIKTTFDLVEKLTPLLNYMFSTLEKFKNENEDYHPECCFIISASVHFTCGDGCCDYHDYHDDWFTKHVVLFFALFGIGDLTNVDIFQKIKLRIKREIEKNPYNLIFNTKPFEIEVIHRIIYPYYEDERIEIKRTGYTERLEEYRRREEEREEESEEEREEPVINTTQSFKSDECAISLTIPPHVLFCNCGHLCLCVESEEVESLVVCPVYKTENTFKKNYRISKYFPPLPGKEENILLYPIMPQR